MGVQQTAMDDGVVDTEHAGDTIEFGSILAHKYTILRPDPCGTPSSFICRDAGSSELRSVWALKPRHEIDPHGDEFRRVLAKVAKLEHPQLRKLLDCGFDPAGIFYAVYQPLELRTLGDLLEQDWPLSDERVVWLTCQLLAALEVAHAAGLTHGDLRPENILVRAGGPVSQTEEIVLCGLGMSSVARYFLPASASRPQLQLAQWMVGTPSHASPEQLRGGVLDARSDIYATGHLLFQLLTRTQAFAGANDSDTAWMQCFTPPPPPSGYSKVSPGLEAICLKALAKTPDVRYQTANEMRGALVASQAAHRPSRSSRVARQSVRPSRPSTTTALTTRDSSVQAEVIMARMSAPSAGLTRRDMFTEAPVETPALARPQQSRRSRSGTWLLLCSTLAITAATIIPDLRVTEPEEENVPALSDLQDGLAKHIPAGALEPDLPIAAAPVARAPVVPVAVALQPAPAVEQSVQPDTGVAMSSEGPQPSAAEATPRAAAAIEPSRRTVAPPRIRVRAIENSVVAAEATQTEAARAEASAVAMLVATKLDDETPASAESAPLPTVPAAAVAPVPVRREPAIELPITFKPLPTVVDPHASAPPMAAADEPPKPIVLTNAPRPGASAPPTSIEVVIGEASAAHGAVSKAALRSALNQSALTRCLRDSVQSGDSPSRTQNARLEIETNMNGRIVSAKLAGSGLSSSLTRCVETAARLGRVREADTGEIRALVDLSFQVK